MPRYDTVTGPQLIENDVCDKCEYFLQACGIWTDLDQNGTNAKYHDKHIVREGEAADRPNYVECKSFRPYVSPQDKEREDPNPHFGRRISNQEFNLMTGQPIDTKPSGPLP